MKVLEKLGIDKTHPFICVLGGNCNVGKSTILAIMAAELVNDGKSILFITDEIKSLETKLNNLISFNNGLLTLQQGIHSSIKYDNYNYVFFDSETNINDEFLLTISNLKNTNGVSIVLSQQLYKDFLPRFSMIHPTKLSFFANYLIIQERIIKKLSILEKIKYFFIGKPNIKLDLIKNRHGKEKSIDLCINFKQINK